MLTTPQQGFAIPPLAVLEEWHPQFALAIRRGAPARPDTRTVSFTFGTPATGDTEPAAIDAQFQTYSVFTGVSTTIDPTNQFPGNPLKTLSDAAQKYVTGITFEFVVQASRENYYAPIATPTPLQSVEPILNPTAGTWAFRRNESIKAQFTQNVAVPAPMTVWITFGILLIASTDCSDVLEMSASDARAELMALRCREKAMCDVLMAKYASQAAASSSSSSSASK